jgi:hypothetical protein
MSRGGRKPDFRSGPAADLARLLRLRAREVTLFDTDAGGAVPPWWKRSSGRRGRRSLLLATCLPAAVAGLAGALLAPVLGGSDRRLGPESAMAADLARDAARPGAIRPLVPVVDRGGRPRLAEHPRASGVAVARPAPPAWISIPRAGVAAPVDSLGARPTGLQVPRLGRAGWWNGGPRPGEDGRAVVVGHLDSLHGPDVFAHVPELTRGDAIVIRDRTGQYHHYAVVGVTRVQKAQFPTADVYGAAPRPVLVLVTCGGPYDKALGHYRDNVLVYARAV